MTRKSPNSMTTWSVIALVAGLVIGGAAHGTASGEVIRRIAEPIGGLWVNALRMIVVPLIVCYVILAIASQSRGRVTGKMGGLSLLLFAALLGLASVFTMTVGQKIFASVRVDPAVTQALQSFAVERTDRGAPEKVPTAAERVTALIPLNSLRAAARDDLLPLLIALVLFSIAFARVESKAKERVLLLISAAADTVGVLVSWILAFIPAGVFALAYTVAYGTGFAIAGSIGYFIVAISLLLIATTLALYPIAVVAGGMTLRRFASGAGPAQAVAVGTRSSLATLPAMVTAAETRMGIPNEVAGFVLPLSVATFKLDYAVTGLAQLFFLTTLYGIPIDAGFLVTFAVSYALFSFAGPGIPGGSGSLVTLPLYISAGVPVEGIALLKAIDVIPDIFKTLLNVTADLTVAAVVNNWAGDARGRAVRRFALFSRG